MAGSLFSKTLIAAAAFPVLAATAAGASTECLVKPHSIARIGAAAKGVIEEVLVDRGDRVVAGQVLVRLEASEEESRRALAAMKAKNETPILAARKRAETAESKVGRLTTLNDRNIISKADVDEAILEAETARLDEEQATLEKAYAAIEEDAASGALERKLVRAPFDGVVTSRLLSAGELYNEQDPILILARTDPLHVETFLPVARRAGISQGMEVEVELETGNRITGKVTVIDPVLDAATGTFGIRIEAPNPDLEILVGQRCTAMLGD